MNLDYFSSLGYELVQTCGACPEQYDVFFEGELVGYLRLRHGYFKAQYPSSGGEIVYEASTIGDGIFAEEERGFHLSQAITAIHLKRMIYKQYE